MKKIILITNVFPFGPGEEFLETEIKYWAQQDDIEFIIMPKRKTDSLREIPRNISVDYTLIEHPIEKINQKEMGLKILGSPVFYKEVYRNRIVNPKQLKHTLISCRDFLHYKNIFKTYLTNIEDKEILFYSYWHTEVCYALQDLKAEFSDIKIVSRIHRFDLYEERRDLNYMPLKQQFVSNIDSLFTISDESKEYVIRQYGFKRKTVKVARLGVEDKQINTLHTDDDDFSLVSCSYISDVKRIDKIIEALHTVASLKPQISYIWTHIGDGPLQKKIIDMAKKELSHIANLQFEFKGHLNNQKVYEFYKNNKIDVFINVSESEGVPVTIMEAMSCHIPIIAPNIGGISEMVIDDENGHLLSSKCNVTEIVESLVDHQFYKNKKIRSSAFITFMQNYNAKINYQSFINTLRTLMEIK